MTPNTLQIDQALRDVVGILAPEQIRQGRDARYLTQADLAANLDVEPAAVAARERGSRRAVSIEG